MRVFKLNNADGFTLTELMVAVLITTVGLLGLLETLTIATAQNMKNMLRDEAVTVAEGVMHYEKVRPFDVLSSSHLTKPSKIRGGHDNFYTVTMASSAWPPPGTPVPATAGKQIMVTVSWGYKGTQYSYQLRSIRSE